MTPIAIRGALVLGVLAAATSARAQPARGPQAEAQAEALFQQGRALMDAGKLAEACDAFEESEKLGPALTTLVNLAGCREKLGQLATAWGLFLDAERQTRSARDDETRQLHASARSHASKLERRISRLTIAVPAANRLPGLEIARGSERVDPEAWNRALPLDGGTYTIAARVPGKQPWSTEVTVGNERDNRTVEIPDLRAAPDAPPAVPPAAPSAAAAGRPTPGPPSQAAPIALGLGALALLGGAAGFDHWSFSLYHQAEAEMTSQDHRSDLYNAANTRRYIAGGLLAAGIGCAGTAAWLYLRAGGERATTAAHHQLVISPAGVAVIGSW